MCTGCRIRISIGNGEVFKSSGALTNLPGDTLICVTVHTTNYLLKEMMGYHSYHIFENHRFHHRSNIRITTIFSKSFQVHHYGLIYQTLFQRKNDPVYKAYTGLLNIESGRGKQSLRQNVQRLVQYCNILGFGLHFQNTYFKKCKH